MNDPYIGQSTDLILGQEFLTWLWFRSENQPAGFTDSEGHSFTVSLEQRIVVQGGEGDAKETASVSGPLSQLREVRMGLCTGKKVARAMILFEREELSWTTVLKAEDFSLSTFRTPRVEHEKDDDPDAVFLEKWYLIEQCLGFLDAAFALFLKVRLSDAWKQEAQDIATWMKPYA